MSQSIVLCGFMGSGKTTIAKMLASHLLYDYIDTDDYIEETSGMKIPEIFSQKGEPYYRELEYNALKKLLGEQRGQVIATGGGMMVDPRNVALCKEEGSRIIFLDIPFDVCYRRIQNSDRPLVRGNSKEELGELYHARRSHYLEACDHRIRGLDSEAIVQGIIEDIQASYTPEEERF